MQLLFNAAMQSLQLESQATHALLVLSLKKANPQSVRHSAVVVVRKVLALQLVQLVSSDPEHSLHLLLQAKHCLRVEFE